MVRYLDTLRQDVAFALRQFARRPSFWASIVATLVVGIAASTVIYAVVDAVLLRPLPYPDPDRLVRVAHWQLRGEYFYLRERATTLEVAAYYPVAQEVTVNADSTPLRVPAAGVTSDLFDVLRVRPALGRGFTAEEMRPDGPGIQGGTYWRTYGVVILSDGFWKTRFAGDPGAIGRTLSIEGIPHTVVGVMPPGFNFPSAAAELWFPHNIDPATMWAGNVAMTIGRLRDGRTFEDAREEVKTLIPTFRELIPWGASLTDYGKQVDLHGLADEIVGGARPLLLLMLASIGVVLLVVCTNVASFLLAHGAARERELATRAALGAERTRLVRQLLVENVAIAVVAGLLGTLASIAVLSLIVRLLPPDLPRLEEIAIDARVLAFAFAVSLGTGVGFGLLPALRATRAGTSLLNRNGTAAVSDPGEGRLTRWLAASELALSVALLVAAVLLLRSLWNLGAVDPGFDVERLVTAKIAPPGFADRERALKDQFGASLLERLETSPGAQAAALATALPLDVGLYGSVFVTEKDPSGPSSFSLYLGVTPGYFAAMRTPLLQGRGFDLRDRADSARVVVVSRTLARETWPDEDPIGKRLIFRDPRQFEYGGARLPWFTVVGVVDDVRFGGPSVEKQPIAYLPLEQFWDTGVLRAIVRMTGGLAQSAPLIRAAVTSLDPLTAVTNVQAYETRLGEALARPRFAAYLLGAFAAVAVFLAAVGVYGVLSYAMSRRVPEIGIRMALGAQPRDVFALLFGQGLRITFVGVAAGLPLAYAATRFVESLLFGVKPQSLDVYAVVVATLVAVGLAASYLPARRAVRVDPVQALRSD
ncbi:MAG TPA: ABC transporter permease [Gammaproteobacteria bacterium]|nr:ABC transporter permease [Gammaproteobacteria bacterium]